MNLRRIMVMAAIAAGAKSQNVQQIEGKSRSRSQASEVRFLGMIKFISSRSDSSMQGVYRRERSQQ